jgi:hypothetical protein
MTSETYARYLHFLSQEANGAPVHLLLDVYQVQAVARELYTSSPRG